MTDIAPKAHYFPLGGPNLGQFFKGWRRKVGIVTLILACLFSAGLLRSDHVLDRGTLRVSGLLFQVTSFHRKIYWVCTARDFSRSQWECRAIRDRQLAAAISEELERAMLECNLSRNGPGLGGRAGAFTYFSTILPLILISVWLLFSKTPTPVIRETAATPPISS